MDQATKVSIVSGITRMLCLLASNVDGSVNTCLVSEIGTAAVQVPFAFPIQGTWCSFKRTTWLVDHGPSLESFD
jgi:hypothetical protein